MIELKNLSSPRVAIPIVGIVVLIVVSTLVAMFYIRNPTVTDNLFGSTTDETTTFSSHTGDIMSNDHMTHTNQASLGAAVNAEEAHATSSTKGNFEHSPSTSSPVTIPTTHTKEDSTTPMHAIEPVQHL
uniref:Uncharacterized protein n=1 Tax=Caenorhabditis japonica TaxID=281687 RepID=A0A8R1E6L6_CAEJA